MWTLRCFNTCIHRCSLSWVTQSTHQCLHYMISSYLKRDMSLPLPVLPMSSFRTRARFERKLLLHRASGKLQYWQSLGLGLRLDWGGGPFAEKQHLTGAKVSWVRSVLVRSVCTPLCTRCAVFYGPPCKKLPLPAAALVFSDRARSTVSCKH